MDANRLGKYELRGELGRGAMGTVYEGFDPAIARRVAIKTVRLPDPTDSEAQEELARFRREAQAAGRLSHPNIVGVFDTGETETLAYIVMEFVDGRTLKAVLDKGERMAPADVGRVMRDVLAGLQYSHDQGVVHRDIKPANIMLTQAGQAKIADFGIARIESSSMTQAGTMLGTPAYMSPEQFMGQTVDARTDIYSAGVLLYQLLTGERPFEGSSLSAIMHKALNTEPLKPSALSVTVPAAMDAVVARALAKRPDERFASAAEFARALESALSDAEGGASAEATIVASGRPQSGAAPKTADAPRAAALAGGPSGANRPADGAPHSRRTAPLLAGAGALALALAAGAWFGLRPAPAPAPASAPAPPATPSGVTAPLPPSSEASAGGAGSPAEPAVPSVPAQQAAPSPVPPSSAAVPAAIPNPAPITTPSAAPEAVAETAPPAGPSVPAPSVAPPPIAPAPSPPPERLALATPPAVARAAVAAAALHAGCTLVGGEIAGATVTVNGLAGVGRPDEALRQAIATAAPGAAIDWHLTRFDGPYCAALDTLRPLRPPFTASAARFDVGLLGGRTRLVDGDSIIVALQLPDFPAYVQMDYFQHDGSVFHMHDAAGGAPWPAGSAQELGRPKPGFSGWQVSEPYGTDMIAAVASSAPLFAKPREALEPAEAYLAALTAALSAAQAAGGRLAADAVVLVTAPKH